MENRDKVGVLGPDGISSTGSSLQDSSTFDDVKQRVADKLHAAAQTIQSKAAENQQSQLAGYANTAAEWLDDTSTYIRNADSQRIKSDIQTKVRRNPGKSLLIAGAAGLLLGVLIRR
ncbi:MAG TPA: DUF883 C-terminal domain-containing protein [Blastocatellia bacterium]|nr:DUF883 C-terminal domain-containing protein [Blastocatellia bacterium]